jgi:two-component system chemotaxis response regulator CheY
MYKRFPDKPDIILMDHRMPIKNGLDASREILELDGHSIIILASADKSVRNEALSMGILSFKDKPFTLQRLFDNIEKALNLIAPMSS